MDGSFPISIVLLGMIAAFLVLRLRSILGRRTGYERPAQTQPTPSETRKGPVIDGKAEPASPARPLPDTASPAGQGLLAIQAADRTFIPAAFLEGAERAFRLIVSAYAAGQRDKLRPLLGDEMYRAFDQAIAAHEAAGETQKSEIRAIPNVTIDAATLKDGHASIIVRFVTDQVNLVLGRDGQPASGTDAVTEITDLWTFERDLGVNDPTWRLIAARSA